LPPPDEEISKRREHENDFDLEDEELSSYNRKINEHSTITSNVLHLYDSSPPPVDDFFIHKTSYEADELEIPEIHVEMDEIENIHHPVNDLENTVPKDETITEEVIHPPNLDSTEEIETLSSIEHNKTDLELITSNNNGDIKETTHRVSDFILQDLPEDDDDDNGGWGDDLETTVVTKNLEEQLPDELERIEESLQNFNDDDDDDFDNFNDFEQAIPIDRHIEQQISIEKTVVEEPNEFQFEADFSAFEVNFDNQFQSFSNSNNEGQEFHTSIEKTVAVIDDETFLNETINDDDDDDFGDFNDFEHQGPSQDTLIAPHEIQQTLSILDDSEVKTILSEMFPVNQIVTDESSSAIYPIINKDKGNDMKIVNDVESTLALSYDYKDSSTNHILIKALGIDERNIVSIFQV